MTSSVLPPCSSKVTVVTAPSSLSSFVQTRRECGVTSMYRPMNAMGFEASWPNSKRYLPPTRTSASQESRDTPVDFGAHHRLSSSGLVHASNTMRAGPLKVRVTTSSRSDFRSTVVRFFMGVGSLSFPASIDFLLPFQFLDNLVQLVEACAPELAVPLDPFRLFLQSAQAELTGPHAPDLLRGDEPGLLQDADMLLHARQGHVELPGKVGDRSVCAPELLQNAPPGGVRERGERGIEAGLGTLNHVVQYITHGLAACKGRPSARCVAGRFHSQIDLISMQIRSTRRSPGLRFRFSWSCSNRRSASFQPGCSSSVGGLANEDANLKIRHYRTLGASFERREAGSRTGIASQD